MNACVDGKEGYLMAMRIAERDQTQAAPFEWIKAVVHQSNPKSFYSDLCK
jgi:hypothetical protein